MISRVVALLLEVGIDPDHADEAEYMLAEKACDRFFFLHNRAEYMRERLDGKSDADALDY